LAVEELVEVGVEGRSNPIWRRSVTSFLNCGVWTSVFSRYHNLREVGELGLTVFEVGESRRSKDP
jgi:hypothetical protein